METNFEITDRYDPHEDLHELHVKEGRRELMVLSVMHEGKIEFCYYNIRNWEYPFCEEPFTENDRARLVAAISDHYAGKGWQVVIDRRRACPCCHERLLGSEFGDWPGGTCEFCGTTIDRFGEVVANNSK